MTNEAQLLVDALEKKKKVLESLLIESKEQERLSKENPFNLEQFDYLVDVKSELMNQLENVDQGFDKVYLRIRDELLLNKSVYSKEIKDMQLLIKDTMDLGAQICATEMRTKDSLSRIFNVKRQELAKKRVATKSVSDYYRSANQLNNLEPFFMDQKK